MIISPVALDPNPCCVHQVDNLEEMDFLYFDKDGFELNVAEQKFYKAMEYPVNYPILNHCCWQEPWVINTESSRLIVDHSMILHRASYSGEAYEQLSMLHYYPYSWLLVAAKQKWGFDFALDSISETGQVFEVLHIEYDSYNFDRFVESKSQIEAFIRSTDWEDISVEIWKNRDQWQHLAGNEQNHWKSNFILGWDRAEYTEKAC